VGSTKTYFFQSLFPLSFSPLLCLLESLNTKQAIKKLHCVEYWLLGALKLLATVPWSRCGSCGFWAHYNNNNRTYLLVKVKPDVILVVTRYYADVEGLVDIRRSENIQRPVGGKNKSDKQYKLHQSPAINDCLYRNMYRFNRIAVIDFDEVGLAGNVNKKLGILFCTFVDVFVSVFSLVCSCAR